MTVTKKTEEVFEKLWMILRAGRLDEVVSDYKEKNRNDWAFKYFDIETFSQQVEEIAEAARSLDLVPESKSYAQLLAEQYSGWYPCELGCLVVSEFCPDDMQDDYLLANDFFCYLSSVRAKDPKGAIFHKENIELRGIQLIHKGPDLEQIHRGAIPNQSEDH